MIRKKVAFISHSCVESSSRTKLAYLARQTELRLISPSWFPTPFGRYRVDYQFNSDVPLQTYPMGFFNIKRTTTRWFLCSRDLGFSKFQPDIIHIENECHSWIVCQALLYRRLFAPRAKVIVFTWDNLYAWELGTKEKTLEHLAKLNCRFIDFFIAGNIAGRDVLLARKVPPENIEVVPQFGIDPEMFFPLPALERQATREDLGISRGEFAVGYVGKLMEEKGLFDLIEAVDQLRKNSQQRVTVLMMGKGESAQEIRSKCMHLGIKLILLPARRNDQVAHVMNAMDVLVLPTHTKPPFKEQFGRVLIEAMACGVPVIGSDCGEIPNVIGDAGLVFPERDCKRFAECLRLCSGDGFRRRLRTRGLDRVLRNYTNQKIADRTLELYDRVTSSEFGVRKSASEPLIT